MELLLPQVQEQQAKGKRNKKEEGASGKTKRRRFYFLAHQRLTSSRSAVTEIRCRDAGFAAGGAAGFATLQKNIYQLNFLESFLLFCPFCPFCFFFLLRCLFLSSCSASCFFFFGFLSLRCSSDKLREVRLLKEEFRGELSLLGDEVVEKALLVRFLQNVLLDRILAHQTIDMNLKRERKR